MPNINAERARFMRQRRVRLTKRFTALGNRMDQLATCLTSEGATMPAKKYNELLSEYRVTERSYDYLKNELRILSYF